MGLLETFYVISSGFEVKGNESGGPERERDENHGASRFMITELVSQEAVIEILGFAQDDSECQIVRTWGAAMLHPYEGRAEDP